jgi:ribosomal protein S12 methylthiotransferase accessory factor
LLQPFSARIQGSFAYGTQAVAWAGNATTYAGAQLVGLCEAFERHAGVTPRGERKVVVGSLGELRDGALDPRDCGLYDVEFYAAHREVEPFSDELRIRWVTGYSLTEARPILVPAQLAYYGTLPAGESRFVFESSNGCATGTCLEEAIFFGMLEVIERDAFLMQWLAELSPVQVDLESVDCPQLQILRTRLKGAGCSVAVLDSRLDLKVPTVIAVTQREGGYGAFLVAAASHLDPRAAILSAVTDAASRQVGFVERTKRQERRLRATLNDFSRVRTISDHGDLYGLPEAAREAAFLTRGPVADYAQLYSGWEREAPRFSDLREDIEWLTLQLCAAGLTRVIVVDQTSPEGLRAGLRTVKVLIPGALPMYFGHDQCRAHGLKRLTEIMLRRHGGAALDRARIPHPFA